MWLWWWIFELFRGLKKVVLLEKIEECKINFWTIFYGKKS